MKIHNIHVILYAILLMIFDLVVLIISMQFALMLHTNNDTLFSNVFDISYLEKYYWIILIVFIILVVEKIYIIRYDFWSDLKRIIKSLFLALITILIVISLAKIVYKDSLSLIVVFFLLALFLLPFCKRLFKMLLFKFELFKVKVKVIANEEYGDVLLTEIVNNWYFGFQFSDNNYDMVLIASKNFTADELQTIMQHYSQKTKDIYVIPYLDYLDFSDINVVNYFNIHLSAIHLENKLLNQKNIFIKYFFEKLIVVCIFPWTLVLHIFLSILIKFDSKGSVIFKQKRLGVNKQIFNCYKYRTMYENSDKLLEEYLKKNPDEIEYYKIYHKYKSDPRITQVGKFLRASSLDEFPQFYNILRGDMNLIGPRPYMINESGKMGQYNEDIILKVKPGLTGFWQVSGRNKLTFQERIELDIWYIQNWSLWIDFVIFIKTIKVVLLKIGAK